MAEEFEDPIEAIKRRNEERARRLKERIASGEFDRFATPLEEVDDTLSAAAGALEAPESDFDLSSFPAPPEPSAISFDEEREAPTAGPPPRAPTEFAPPSGAEEPEFAPPPEIGAGEPEFAPPAFAPMEDTLAGLELTELDLEGVGGFLAPEPWEIPPEVPLVEAAAPPPAVEVPPVPAEAAVAGIPPELEIEVEPAAPLRMEAALRAMEEEEVVAAAAEIGEPALREEEAEAIKATIEEELREIPPAAPPMPPRRAEIPAYAAAAVAPPPEKEEAEIFIGVEVRGNKVRVERRNITLAATVDLFRSIIDRYQNK
jgi:hypothetical protein